MSEVACFDVGSGGMSAARFNENLEARGYHEIPWAPPFSGDGIQRAFDQLKRAVCGSDPVAAISISSFMHSFLRTGPSDHLYTWMDKAPPEGIDAIRRAIGSDFHRRTGCHYHPMFPVFKLAAMQIADGSRIASPKSLLIEQMTGTFVEDYGMAAASGLMNVHSSQWDDGILRACKLTPEMLPQLLDPGTIVGQTTGVPVVNGSGDGFMANVGSGCESAQRIAITLGTSAAVRQMVTAPSLNPEAGTFCYRAESQDSFLLGCASSNGGNVLDWARREFGVCDSEVPKREIPVFLPWLNGERSLEWNSELRPAWYGRRVDHTPVELFRAVMEGVVFNLAHYVETIEKSSGIRANQIVLSGNGFLDPAVAPMLAALLSHETLQPESSGLGTLRGTAKTAWRALGHDATPAVEALLDRAQRVVPIHDDRMHNRFAQFKHLRKNPSPEGRGLGEGYR